MLLKIVIIGLVVCCGAKQGALREIAWNGAFGFGTREASCRKACLGVSAREHTEEGRNRRMKNHLTEEQARKLLEALPGHSLEAIIMLALITGLRRDELLRLTWQDLDLEKREVRVRNTKTKSGDRMIHLPEGVTEVLKQHHIRQMEARVEAGPAGPHLDLVFPDRSGGVLGPDQLVKGFYEILEQAGLPPLRFHELREARWRALTARLSTAKEELEGAHGGSLDLENDPYPL